MPLEGLRVLACSEELDEQSVELRENRLSKWEKSRSPSVPVEARHQNSDLIDMLKTMDSFFEGIENIIIVSGVIALTVVVAFAKLGVGAMVLVALARLSL